MKLNDIQFHAENFRKFKPFELLVDCPKAPRVMKRSYSVISLREFLLEDPENDVGHNLRLCLRKTLVGKSPDYRHAVAFEKLRFQNAFRPH